MYFLYFEFGKCFAFSFIKYPKGLGPTVSELDITKAVGVYPKTKFSMLIPEVEKALDQLSRPVKSVILCGIEVRLKAITVAHISSALYKNSGFIWTS